MSQLSHSVSTQTNLTSVYLFQFLFILVTLYAYTTVESRYKNCWNHFFYMLQSTTGLSFLVIKDTYESTLQLVLPSEPDSVLMELSLHVLVT